MGLIDHRFEDNFITTSIDRVLNWARESSIWPMGFGLACCAIEMIASSTSRFDIARFGSEVFRPSPRQADLMIVSGTGLLLMRRCPASELAGYCQRCLRHRAIVRCAVAVRDLVLSYLFICASRGMEWDLGQVRAVRVFWFLAHLQ